VPAVFFDDGIGYGISSAPAAAGGFFSASSEGPRQRCRRWMHGLLRRKQHWASTALLDSSKCASSSRRLLRREQQGASTALPTSDAWASSAQAALGLDSATG